MILVHHLVRSAMCLSMDFSASSKTVLPCTSNFKDCSRPSSFLHSKPASMKMCEIFPPDMDWLLCKYEAEDATCQTELLIDGFSSQGHIRESTSLCAHLRLSLGFRFACSTLHACSACMDIYENFQDNDIGLLSGHCSAESVCSWSRTRAMGSGACTVLTEGSATDIRRTALLGSKLVCRVISCSCFHFSFSSISTEAR